MQSLFVTLEGIEGSGKSSLQHCLAQALKKELPEVVLTREPGATWLGEAIRSILLNPGHKHLDAFAELALFAADRAQHVSDIIRPALARNALVLCDRYTHSTLAYQGYGRGLPLDELMLLNQLATGGLEPELVLLLDLPAEEGLKRAKKRTEALSDNTSCANGDLSTSDVSWSRFEQEELAFHRRVREGYLEMAKVRENNFVVLDAGQRLEDVAQAALGEILLRLKKGEN
jgi:dTMP kinase